MTRTRVNKHLLLAFILAALAGAALHFLYRALPNPITALIAPVNESLWEHVKILYWPYLAAMLLLTRKAQTGGRSPWLLSLLVIEVLMLIVAYAYHILLGYDSLSFDLALYVLLMAAGFWLPGRLCNHNAISIAGGALQLLVLLFGALIALFTFLPPDSILFADLSSVNTWYTIPY